MPNIPDRNVKVEHLEIDGYLLVFFFFLQRVSIFLSEMVSVVGSLLAECFWCFFVLHQLLFADNQNLFMT